MSIKVYLSLTFVCLLVARPKLTSAGVSPSRSFILAFAQLFNKSKVNVYLPLKTIVKANAQFGSFPLPATMVYQESFESNATLHLLQEGVLCVAGTAATPTNLDDMKAFLESSLSLRTKASKEYWLVGIASSLLNNPPEKGIEALFRNVPLDLNDDVFVYIDPLDTGQKVDIFEVYKIGPKEYPIINLVGNWTKSSGQLAYTNAAKYERRKDLRGYNFIVGTIQSPPYIQKVHQDSTGALTTFDGMFADIFKQLKGTMNFTYTLVLPPDGQFGAVQEDGTWSGIVGQLTRSEVDICVTDLTITQARSTVVSFPNPITMIYHSVFIQNPKEGIHLKAYTDPLQYLSWVMIGVYCLVVPPILFIAARIGQLDENIGEFTVPKSYVFAASAMTMRGWSVEPSTWKARIAFVSLLLGGILIYWHWEAMLISYLSTRVVHLPFKTMQGLYDSSYSFYTQPGTSFWDSFKLSTDDLWLKIYDDMLLPNEEDYVQFMKTTDGFDALKWLMKDEQRAVYDNFFAIAAQQEYRDCKIIAVPGKYNSKPYSIAFQMNSPYLEAFDYQISLNRENGNLAFIVEEYGVKGQVCPDYSGKPLTIGNCFTAFLCLMVGMGLGLVLFILEFVTRHTGLNFALVSCYGNRKTPTSKRRKKTHYPHRGKIMKEMSKVEEAIRAQQLRKYHQPYVE